MLYQVKACPKWDSSVLNLKGYENFSVANSEMSRILRHIDIEKFLS